MSTTSTKEQFRTSLIKLVNQQIKVSGISPEVVATVFAEEAKTALEHLAWIPHAQRAAREHFVAAATCLRDGRVIPVPSFEVLFPNEGTEI